MSTNRRTVFTLEELNQMAEKLKSIPAAIQRVDQDASAHQQHIVSLQPAIQSADTERKIAADEVEHIRKIPKTTFWERLVACCSSEKSAELDRRETERARLPKVEQTSKERGDLVSRLATEAAEEEKIMLADAKEHQALEQAAQTINSIDLVTKPKECLTNLIDNLGLFHIQFEKDFPAGQSEYVRRCLADMSAKVKVIMSQTSDEKDIDAQAEARLKYFQLYGMINKMLENVELSRAKNSLSDEAFAKRLRSTIYTVDKTLGPVIVTDAIEHYDAFTKIVPELTVAELIQQEKQKYAEERNKLAVVVTALGDAVAKRKAHIDSDFEKLYLHSKNLLDTFDSANTAKNLPRFDRKFRTSILTTTRELLLGRKQEQPKEPQVEGMRRKSRASKNGGPREPEVKEDPVPTIPATPETYARYQQYLNLEKNGRPSNFKKVVGAMYMFFGALMVVGSIAAKVFSYGLSTPASTYTLLAGVGLFGAGLCLFRGGMRKNVKKSIYKIEKLSQESQVRDKLTRFGVLAHVNANYEAASKAQVVAPSAPELRPPSYADATNTTGRRSSLLKVG